MIRSFLVIVFLILFFIFSLIALPVEWVIGKFNPDVKAVSSLRIVQGAFHIILFLAGVHTTVTDWKISRTMSRFYLSETTADFLM